MYRKIRLCCRVALDMSGVLFVQMNRIRIMGIRSTEMCRQRPTISLTVASFDNTQVRRHRSIAHMASPQWLLTGSPQGLRV